MLQDAIWADTERLADDAAYADAAVKLPQGRHQGLDLRARQPRGGARRSRTTPRSTPGSFPVGTEPPALADERDQQAHLGRAGGIGLIDEAAWDKTVAGALAAKNQDGSELITAEPAEIGVLERVHRAGARGHSKDEGVEVGGEDYARSTSPSTEGGN